MKISEIFLHYYLIQSKKNQNNYEMNSISILITLMILFFVKKVSKPKPKELSALDKHFNK